MKIASQVQKPKLLSGFGHKLTSQRVKKIEKFPFSSNSFNECHFFCSGNTYVTLIILKLLEELFFFHIGRLNNQKSYCLHLLAELVANHNCLPRFT